MVDRFLAFLPCSWNLCSDKKSDEGLQSHSIKSGRIISAPTGISSKQKIQLSQNISKNFASLYMKGKFLPKQNNRAENFIKNLPSA